MMNRLALVGYLAFALVAVSLVNRLGAQTQPLGGAIAVAVNGGASGAPSRFPDGTQGAPSISFTSTPDAGFFNSSSSGVTATFGGNQRWGFTTGAFALTSGYLVGWTTALGSASDVGIGRNAAGVLEVNNGATAGTRASLTLANGGALIFGATTFATLNANAANGTLVFCSDCTLASALDQACVGGGTGALAVRQASSWRCFS